MTLGNMRELSVQLLFFWVFSQNSLANTSIYQTSHAHTPGKATAKATSGVVCPT
jgi:hypothetical protein